MANQTQHEDEGRLGMIMFGLSNHDLSFRNEEVELASDSSSSSLSSWQERYLQAQVVLAEKSLQVVEEQNQKRQLRIQVLHLHALILEQNEKMTKLESQLAIETSRARQNEKNDDDGGVAHKERIAPATTAAASVTTTTTNFDTESPFVTLRRRGKPAKRRIEDDDSNLPLSTTTTSKADSRRGDAAFGQHSVAIEAAPFFISPQSALSPIAHVDPQSATASSPGPSGGGSEKRQGTKLISKPKAAVAAAAKKRRKGVATKKRPKARGKTCNLPTTTTTAESRDEVVVSPERCHGRITRRQAQQQAQQKPHDPMDEYPSDWENMIELEASPVKDAKRPVEVIVSEVETIEVVEAETSFLLGKSPSAAPKSPHEPVALSKKVSKGPVSAPAIEQHEPKPLQGQQHADQDSLVMELSSSTLQLSTTTTTTSSATTETSSSRSNQIQKRLLDKKRGNLWSAFQAPALKKKKTAPTATKGNIR